MATQTPVPYFSVPAVVAGLLVDVIGLRTTTLGYCAVLAVAALPALPVLRRRTAEPAGTPVRIPQPA